MYSISKANKSDINLLIKFKLDTILDSHMNEDELTRINNYVKESTIKNIDNYKLIKMNNNIIGSYLIYSYEDGILIDEIYLIEEYRNRGIGSKIIKDLQNNHKLVYLWVRNNNHAAIELYKRLNFKIIEENDLRTKMFYKNIH